MKTEHQKILKFAAAAGVVYLIAKAWGLGAEAAAIVGKGYSNAREALASGLFRVFGPTLDTTNDLLYTVKFADGNHSVPASSVNKDGIFSRNGTNYRLVIDTRITKGVNKAAFPL